MLDVVDRTLRGLQNVARETHPAIARVLSTPVRLYIAAWIKVATIRGSLRYAAPIQPTRIYYADPQRIDRAVTWTDIPVDKKASEHPRFRPPNYRLAGRVFDGEWDRVDDRVSESTIYRSFVAHFQDGVPWQETRFYDETLRAIESGQTLWSCASRSDLDRRCEHLDDLYDRIATEGYKTQDELYDSQGSTLSQYRFYRVLWGEIAVHVGRDGEFVFQDGRNRLAIARVLGLEAVPVVILVRHEQWQRLRDQLVTGELAPSNLTPELRTHPDVVDLF